MAGGHRCLLALAEAEEAPPDDRATEERHAAIWAGCEEIEEGLAENQGPAAPGLAPLDLAVVRAGVPGAPGGAAMPEGKRAPEAPQRSPVMLAFARLWNLREKAVVFG